MDILPRRFQGGSVDSIDTSKSKYYQRGFKWCVRYLEHNNIKGDILDPFARSCDWGDITNDLDADYNTTFNLDCLDFLKKMKDSSAKLILFDPPFSDAMNARKYKGSSNLYASDTSKISQCQKQFKRILKPGGLVIKLGYNSGRPIGLELISTTCVNFGGNRNDVIMSIWQRKDSNLFEF